MRKHWLSTLVAFTAVVATANSIYSWKSLVGIRQHVILGTLPLVLAYYAWLQYRTERVLLEVSKSS
jgi:hypothetical protein